MKFLVGVKNFMKSTGQFFFYFRKVFMAIPVIVAVYLQAKNNLEQLPAKVGLILAKDGTYAMLITKDQAVFFPVVITLLCLICMFLSRKAFYPWLISIVTLIIPTLLLMLNQLF